MTNSCHYDSSFARIVDCRPFKSALANKAKGMGYEDEFRYTNTSISFQNIQNIHVSRKSYAALFTLICGTGTRGSNSASTSNKHGFGWLSLVEATGWLNHVRSILCASITVARYIGLNGFPVLVHCSDGWDRTSQVCALSQILLDPFFRTISGLQLLIEKDWVSFGHKFMKRIGHGSDEDSEERAPCFLLFIDCIWQLIHIFPKMFEFNENFLVCIADSVLCCKYGTFLCDSEAYQKQMLLEQKSISLWEYVNENFEKFKNVSFDSNPDNSLSKCFLPHESIVSKQVTLWNSYYLRYSSAPSLNSQRFVI